MRINFNFFNKKDDKDLSNNDGGWDEDSIWETHYSLLSSFREKYGRGERAVLKKLPFRPGQLEPIIYEEVVSFLHREHQ